MPVTDADTHVTECDATLSYLADAELRLRPAKGEMTTANGSTRAYWLVDGLPRGRRRPREGDPVEHYGRALDIPTRLKATHDMGVQHRSSTPPSSRPEPR
jgi:hypothetical protein